MVSDLNKYKSHPNKLLLEHIEGVSNNVKRLTNSKVAELVAVFHDLGKLNPNFQRKLFGLSTNNGYSNHAYLSAFAFFCMVIKSTRNKNVIKTFLNCDTISNNDIIAICVLIAKHHGNIPDFEPKCKVGEDKTILSKEESNKLFTYLDNLEIPVYKYARQYFEVDDFFDLMKNEKVQRYFIDKFVFFDRNNSKPLEFFIDYQFSFACLIQADKADAADFDNFITKRQNEVNEFSDIYINSINHYLSSLKQNSDLNILRTKIRIDAIKNLKENVSSGRVFELTAPTGSGKTLMLLSLASEIIKQMGPKRIIYGLPFLSITEQVEDEVLKIFKDNKSSIQRIDSKSENCRYEKIQEQLDNDPNSEIIKELGLLEFQENTFSYPFVITTFVRFFETLLSNKNADLLKLPNFSNCIFLLDEIQSLPPRLYGFFVGYITKFCNKFNSYAIISTATQPNFSLPDNNKEAEQFFYDYKKPISLLKLDYFKEELFNRYTIIKESAPINIEQLGEKLILEDQSVLVILNTIDDTTELYNLLTNNFVGGDIILLNTHFTPRHRKIKIYLAKRRLRESKKVIVISTQLIEAGVDIDFPILYRDFTTTSSIVQSAGRCNRNGKIPGKGIVHLFRLSKNGKLRSELIYRGIDADLLRFTNDALCKGKYEEKDLLNVQKSFFDRIIKEWHFAKHWQNNPKIEFDFIKDIQQCMYDKIGKFQLIDKEEFGEELQFYVPRNQFDTKFELLLDKQKELISLLKINSSMPDIKLKKREIDNLLKTMSNNIIQIHLKKNQTMPILGNEKTYFNLYKLDSKCYSFSNGIDLLGQEFIL
jgi:CRISPR-associated endonuclease/helicase Cas3